MLCDVFDSAKDDTNLHNNCSEVGVGIMRSSWQRVRYFIIPAVYVLVVDGASPALKYRSTVLSSAAISSLGVL